MATDNITKLLDNSDHAVVERYLIAFVGYPGNLESATRDDILHETLPLDIDLNIRLHENGVAFFNRDGDAIPTPSNWKAQQLLGFESRSRYVTLQQIVDDIEDYDPLGQKNGNWPWFTDLCVWCGCSRSMRHSELYCKACHDRGW